ncbi:hypothetical protein PENSPDRAFT_658467, partial [Peniophora sp. CONT]
MSAARAAYGWQTVESYVSLAIMGLTVLWAPLLCSERRLPPGVKRMYSAHSYVERCWSPIYPTWMLHYCF